MSRLLGALALGLCFVVACSQSAPRPGATGTAGTGGAAAGAAGATGGAAGAATAGEGGAGATGTAGPGGSAGASAGGASGAAAGADGGSTDGGSTNGGSPDAAGDLVSDASDAGAGGCPYVLCETFGGAAPGGAGSPWAYDVDNKGTVAEVVSDKGRTDSRSLHVKASAMAGIHGYITETETLAKTGGSFWGRVFIWYMLDVPGVHIVNVAVDGKTGTTSEQVRIVNVIGSHIATNRRSDDMGKGSNVGPDQGKWGCYEWHLTPNSLDVYLDGTMLPISETWTMPTLSLFRVGFERFSAGAAGELWLDDVAINDSRIGCD
jgi:hypothetical protein